MRWEGEWKLLNSKHLHPTPPNVLCGPPSRSHSKYCANHDEIFGASCWALGILRKLSRCFMLCSWYLWKALDVSCCALGIFGKFSMFHVALLVSLESSRCFMLCSWYLWKALDVSCYALHIVGKLSMMSKGAPSWIEIFWSYSVGSYWLLNHFFNEN
jgi:hypothetical protein